jgi:hypothetical protein
MLKVKTNCYGDNDIQQMEIKQAISLRKNLNYIQQLLWNMSTTNLANLRLFSQLLAYPVIMPFSPYPLNKEKDATSTFDWVPLS